MKLLTEVDEKERDPVVWVKEGNRGGPNTILLKTGMREGYEATNQKQYLISVEGQIGLKPVIKGLINDGLLEPFLSPFNTPVLMVRKADSTDLRKINDIVQKWHPVILNPYTLMSKIPHECKWFSVIDLKDAF